MLTEILRRAHHDALTELNRIEIYCEELIRVKEEHRSNPTARTLWAIEWYKSKKAGAIDNYSEIMQSIVEPILLRNE